LRGFATVVSSAALLEILVGDYDDLRARLAMWSKTTDRLYADRAPHELIYRAG
jgi:hypothetical protein